MSTLVAANEEVVVNNIESMDIVEEVSTKVNKSRLLDDDYIYLLWERRERKLCFR